MLKKFSILIAIRQIESFQKITNSLKEEGYCIKLVENSKEILEKIRRKKFDLIIIDLDKKLNNVEILKKIKTILPEVKIIILLKPTEVKNALKLIKEGIYDYLKKPFICDELKILIRRAIGDKSKEDSLLKSLKTKKNFENVIIGESKKIQKILQDAQNIAPTDITVLIQGETGTGKELIASTIYSLSKRKNKPFLKINCAALPADLLESELFGHEKEAFTGADHPKFGLFSCADKGTILLDEISEASLDLQAKLLRVVEEKEFIRVGGRKSIKVDVRIIAASNKDLEECIQKGKFRRDLYHRLNIFPIFIHPLRERKEDIPLLLHFFLNQHNKKLNKNIEGVSEEVKKIFLNYEWPGNVRELKNLLLVMVINCKERIITIKDIPKSFFKKSEGPCSKTFLPDIPPSFKEAKQNIINSFEETYFKSLLYTYKGNILRSAESAQITRPFLYKKIKEHKIDLSDFRSGEN